MNGKVWRAAFLAGSILWPAGATAKRVAPPALGPVVYQNIRYSAVYEGVGGRIATCSVVARDAATGKRLWKTTLYKIRYDRGLETDVQDVWPKSIRLQGGVLLVVNERNEAFRVNRATGSRLK